MASKQVTITLYKNRGETPLECLDRFKKENPEYEEVGPQGTLVRHDFAKSKMTYAGRLDPLAEGLLLVLVGEECKKKEKYLGLDKEYEVDVLFGFATDTYDVLGILQASQTYADYTQTDAEKFIHLDTKCPSGYSCKKSEKFSEVGLPHAFEVVPQKISSTNLDSRLHGNGILGILQSFVGKFPQKYPPFSSKTIKGKTMFSLFKSGELNNDEIPSKDIEIKNIEYLGKRTISKNDLEQYIINSVNLVKGDFRQKEILKKWKRVLSCVIPAEAGIQNTFNLDSCLRRNDNTNQFLVISIRVNCTSGTYMRSLANSIGEKVGIPALALNIKRTRIYENKSNE